MIKNIFRNFFSRPLFQPFFELLLFLSLKGLNIGDGHSVETSGEENVIRFIKKRGPLDSATIFDVGAHTGEWLQMFRKHSKQAKVFCFEPSPDAYHTLHKTSDPHTTFVQSALGEQTGTAYLESNVLGDSQAHLLNSPTDKTNSVPVTTVDMFCKKNNIQKIDLLKMDVEGYELKVLHGAREMLQKGAIRCIQFEFGSLSEERPSLKEFFETLGNQYVFYRILKKGLRPINYRHYFEIHTTTNFLAVQKISTT